MSNASKREYLQAIRPRYHHASKTVKRIILDEFCRVCTYNRKYAIRLLNAQPSSQCEPHRQRPGRRPKYQHPDLKHALVALWKAGNLPCGKRLKAMIALWLPHYPTPLEDQIKQLLTTIAPATIDRLLAPLRTRYSRQGLATTKPGSLIKQHIPIKTNQWDERIPGFLEADTVAHCGSSMAGMFAYTVNMVDIATTWTEQRAIWGKGEQGVIHAITCVEQMLPFPVRGFDCDNGSEFINWPLLKYFTQRPRPVQYTRSREYRKNDNAHIEGKNWTIVRQYLGYDRFEDPAIVSLLNDLYTTQWRFLLNFFMPSMKLIDKQRIKSRIIKRYDAPQTPLQRVLASTHVATHTKRELRLLVEQLNPFDLQRKVSTKIKRILRLVAQPHPRCQKQVEDERFMVTFTYEAALR
jgi:hypothetical protein